jgi:hypothetical protein
MAPLMSFRRGLHSALAIVLLAGITHAQQTSRDTAIPRAKTLGTAVVAGVVTLGDDVQTPVRRAVVELVAADRVETLAAITDDKGAYVIERVPAGRYTIRATKPAHITMPYGARRSDGAGTVLVVGDGGRITDIRLVLPRGAVLAGRVTLSSGQPLPNVQVIAVPSRLMTAGGTPPTGSRVFRTNDLGDFRLFGLPPGAYVVAALPTFGRGDLERMTDREATELLRQLEQPTGRAGGTRAPGPLVTFAPTYFPGTPSVGQATLIQVEHGQVRDDLHFSITTFPAAAIRGRVVGVDGGPTRAVTLSIEAVGPPLPIAGTALPRIERPGADGVFQVNGLSPGLYRLRARGGGVTVNAMGDGAQTRPEAQTQSATLEVSVAGFDIEGVVLGLQEGGRMSGRFTVRATEVPPSWAGASVILQPLTQGPNNSTGGVLTPGVPRREGTADAAGDFTVTGLEPVEYEVVVTLPTALRSSGWHVETIRHNNTDVRDRPIVFGQESLNDVEVRVTQAVTELTGTLASESGTPAADYFVVVFPADRDLWHAASPRVRVVRPAADGTFRVGDLLPGTYRISALTDVESAEEKERSFLEAIYAASVEVTVNHGQSTRQDLRIKGTK